MCTREYYMCNFLFTLNRNASIQMISHMKHIYCGVAHTLNEIILQRHSGGTKETVEIIVLV